MLEEFLLRYSIAIWFLEPDIGNIPPATAPGIPVLEEIHSSKGTDECTC
jgi:hypothetical protein